MRGKHTKRARGASKGGEKHAGRHDTHRRRKTQKNTVAEIEMGIPTYIMRDGSTTRRESEREKEKERERNRE